MTKKVKIFPKNLNNPKTSRATLENPNTTHSKRNNLFPYRDSNENDTTSNPCAGGPDYQSSFRSRCFGAAYLERHQWCERGYELVQRD